VVLGVIGAGVLAAIAFALLRKRALRRGPATSEKPTP
jgi:hypothetical protein